MKPFITNYKYNDGPIFQYMSNLLFGIERQDEKFNFK